MIKSWCRLYQLSSGNLWSLGYIGRGASLISLIDSVRGESQIRTSVYTAESEGLLTASFWINKNNLTSSKVLTCFFSCWRLVLQKTLDHPHSVSVFLNSAHNSITMFCNYNRWYFIAGFPFASLWICSGQSKFFFTSVLMYPCCIIIKKDYLQTLLCLISHCFSCKFQCDLSTLLCYLLLIKIISIDMQMYIPYSNCHTMHDFFNYLTFQEIFITISYMFVLILRMC